MTPEAVIDRYLEIASREPFDPVAFVRLLGTDADLLGRWLQVLSCEAEPAALLDALTALPADRFQELALAQALAVLTVSGSVRLSFDQWQSVLHTSLVGEALGTALGLPDPAGLRWRLLLAASGVNLPQDATLTEMLALRGSRPELLEDASLVHRVFAIVESLDVIDPLQSRDAAAALLGIDSERFRDLLTEADRQARALLTHLDLPGEDEMDSAERLWLRLQVATLGRLLEPAFGLPGAGQALEETHRLVALRLFGRVPELFVRAPQGARLLRIGGGGPEIAVASRSSRIARSARDRARVRLVERPDQAVADRQVLRRLACDDALCVPLLAGGETSVGVLVFATDEDVDQELAMGLYADELAKRLSRPELPAAPGGPSLADYQQQEARRLRELVHEATNPLTVVTNYLHILEARLAGEPDVVGQLQMLGSEIRRASDLFLQARDLSSIEPVEREEAVVPVTSVDLNEFVSRAVELHRGYAHQHNVSLLDHYAAERLDIQADEHRLAQILNNLVRNAIEAAPGATVTVSTITGVFRESREGALLEVADTGPGLPRAVLAGLGGPQQSEKGGTHAGLGLHIVYRLVKELGAGIDVRTAPGQGTTFSLFLPRRPAAG